MGLWQWGLTALEGWSCETQTFCLYQLVNQSVKMSRPLRTLTACLIACVAELKQVLLELLREQQMLEEATHKRCHCVQRLCRKQRRLDQLSGEVRRAEAGLQATQGEVDAKQAELEKLREEVEGKLVERQKVELSLVEAESGRKEAEFRLKKVESSRKEMEPRLIEAEQLKTDLQVSGNFPPLIRSSVSSFVFWWLSKWHTRPRLCAVV